MKLKLTNREKNLLAVFGLCIVITLIYYAVIKPQLDIVSRLEKQAEEYSIAIQSMKAKADPHNPAYKEYNELYNKTQLLLKPFYSEIMQEKIIILLEDKIKLSNITVNEITFTGPAPSDLQEPKVAQPIKNSELEVLIEKLRDDMKPVPVKKESSASAKETSLLIGKMTVTINFEGSYNQLYDFIKLLEQEKRSTACTNLSIESSGAGLLTGVISIDFYSIPKPFVQNQEDLYWNIHGSYGKTNPFGNIQLKSAIKDEKVKDSIGNP